MTDSTLITAEQVATINAARTVLKTIAKSALYDHDSQASGVVHAIAEEAESSLFQLLNWFNAFADGGLSNKQLHNR